MTPKKLYIDVTPICRSARSGVSHSLLQLLQALDSSPDFTKEYQLIAFAPKSLIQNSGIMREFKYIQLVGIPVPAKLFQVLFRLGLLPPIDIFLGKGIYCFYDYRLLPLTKASPALVCIHDLTFLKYPQFLETKNLHYLRKIIPQSVRGAETIVCVSEAAKAELTAEYPEAANKTTVLYNTVDGRAFKRQSSEIIQRTMEKYGLPSEPTLLFIGNMEPRKNISALLTAYEKLGSPSDLPPLVLVGSMTWGADDIKSRLDGLQKRGYKIVTPSKYVEDEDIPALISSAYCLILPSFYEGFGYPPLQAILCATPAIVSEDMPVNEVIGDYVTKISPRDIDQLTNVLHNTIHNGYKEIVVDREKVLERVGYQRTAVQFLSIARQMTRE